MFIFFDLHANQKTGSIELWVKKKRNCDISITLSLFFCLLFHFIVKPFFVHFQRYHRYLLRHPLAYAINLLVVHCLAYEQNCF